MDFYEKMADQVITNNGINAEMYSRYNVKRGLRNSDGSGVLVGLTTIGEVHGYIFDESEKHAVDGRLRYRGIEIQNIVEGFQKEGRFGFEETAFLLLFGTLPTGEQLEQFNRILEGYRELPDGFTENMILKSPSSDIMNKLARSVLACYSYDNNNPDDTGICNVLQQCVQLLARFPTMTAYGYQAKRHYYDNESLFIHRPQPGLSTAENFLYLIRPDSKFTRLEAETLDLALVLHAEHGGGNNSAFALHVVTSTGTDTYSAIAAAVGSLKGPKHGGANIRVMRMMEDLKQNVKDCSNEKQIEDYLVKLVRKEAYDRCGLIYGMGHAVYTLSDPRTAIMRDKARELAVKEKDKGEFELYETVERISHQVLRDLKNKEIATNVDFYSGLVYSMLNIPPELYTPIFAVSRIAGWAAHRIEELVGGGRIIRPAYKSVSLKKNYIPLDRR